ncbi:MAG: hypothetical protein FWD17_16390 [Polyangiaceae bacterium]|nr:hypothetical protein [Polyangiaceae bacterium]
MIGRLSRAAFGPGLFCAATFAACGEAVPETGTLAPACVDADSDPTADVPFASMIRPWMDRSETDPLAHGCKRCHYASAPEPMGIELGGLDMTTLASLRRGGRTSGTNIVIPGKPCESVLVQKLRGDYGAAPARMPKDGPPYWPDNWIQAVSDWIAEGAHGADDD